MSVALPLRSTVPSPSVMSPLVPILIILSSASVCASVNVTAPKYVRLSKAAARSADMPDSSIVASPVFPPDASKSIVPVVAALIAFKSPRICGCVIKTFAASKLTIWAFSSVTLTSSADPVI